MSNLIGLRIRRSSIYLLIFFLISYVGIFFFFLRTVIGPSTISTIINHFDMTNGFLGCICFSFYLFFYFIFISKYHALTLITKSLVVDRRTEITQCTFKRFLEKNKCVTMVIQHHLYQNVFLISLYCPLQTKLFV